MLDSEVYFTERTTPTTTFYLTRFTIKTVELFYNVTLALSKQKNISETHFGKNTFEVRKRCFKAG